MIPFEQPDITFIHLPETDSTNNYLSTLSAHREIPEFTVVYADFQTAGKGQRNNSWESEAGANLLFSSIIYPTYLEVRKQFLLSQIAALAVKDELDVLSDGFSIKWPNDIYWRGQKICGMLIEHDILGSCIRKSIIGIGINTNQKSFSDAAPNPVSLWQITGVTHDNLSLLHRIATRIAHYCTLLKEKEEDTFRQRYHEALFRKNGYFRYRDPSGEFMARIVCIKPEGTLVLEDEAGKKKGYLFKEVQYVL